MKSEVFNLDCLEAMRQMSDKAFDLAIVDPPYGIGAGATGFINGNRKVSQTFHRTNDWDIKPNQEYFTELFRVSKEQIIWGGNYFLDYLPSTQGFIVWDKTIHGNSYADCEFAWTSFQSPARIFRKNIVQVTLDGRIHPTQKPVALYLWLLKTYSKPGQSILDTHLGSGASRIAANDFGLDFTGYEIDRGYFESQGKRFEAHRMLVNVFEQEEEKLTLTPLDF